VGLKELEKIKKKESKKIERLVLQFEGFIEGNLKEPMRLGNRIKVEPRAPAFSFSSFVSISGDIKEIYPTCIYRYQSSK
jgi:hypothetical protein